jgi:S1-C subfamily serine protease
VTSPLGTDAFAALSGQLADLAERVAPAIVQVFGRKRPASGIVIAPERVVSTSHSVEWREGVRIRTNDGKTLTADVAGHAPGADLVLLKVPGLGGSPFPGATAPRPGQLGLLTGRAWSGIQQVRLATIGGVGGPFDASDGTRLDRVISLPTYPYPGFSGNALVDPGGSLIGIATAGLIRGRGLVVPWMVASPLLDSLEAHGSIRRGFLGVTSQPVRIPGVQRGTPPGPESGLIVLGIANDSPAARDGILVGDILIRAGGERVEHPQQLLAMLGPSQVGQPLVLTVIRGKEQLDLTVTVGERPVSW